MWIWQNSDWPHFEFDAAAASERVEVFYRSAERLSGRIEGMSSRYQSDAVIDLMLSEAITTSAIEGETLDRESVRSSLLHLIGTESASPNADEKAAGAAALIVDARKNWNQPLDHDLLGGWQTMACPENLSSLVLRGMYRADAMQIVSGPIGHYRVYYEAPPAKAVRAEMDRFLDWYNGTTPKAGQTTELPGPIRAAVAHLWFESIHPFDDGNGRVGRAIADHALSQSLGRPTIACLATAINEDRKTYYSELGRATRSQSLEIRPFIDYFTATVNQAQDIAKDEVNYVLDKARFYEEFAGKMNPRQEKAIARMFAEGRKGFEGGMSTKKYMAITACSTATATRDLGELREIGALAVSGQGRSTRYTLAAGQTGLSESLTPEQRKKALGRCFRAGEALGYLTTGQPGLDQRHAEQAAEKAIQEAVKRGIPEEEAKKRLDEGRESALSRGQGPELHR